MLCHCHSAVLDTVAWGRIFTGPSASVTGVAGTAHMIYKVTEGR